MNPTALAFLERLRDARESSTGSLGRLSHWLEKHTTIAGRPFSFRDHEFQRDICDDTAHTMVVIKPSQVGLSELTARMTLAFLATNQAVTAIYGLQTVFFSSRFFKSRIDPIIRESKTLSGMILPASDSASFKQFTNGSQLHGAGFSAGIAVISVPSSAVIADETDFCDPQSIATAESRLSHSPFVDPETGVRGIRRFFSTPTVPDYGVSGLFEKSNKRRRMVRCKCCTEWFWPNLLEQCVIDGWDQTIADLTAVDAKQLDDRGLLSSARLLCPKCHEPVSRGNLAPEYREWVAEKPEIKRMSGWQVSPFDLPAYHTPESLLRKLIETGDHAVQHWHNFALGLPYASALNSVAEGAVSRNTSVKPYPPDGSDDISGCVVGLDVGKISWITIGKVVDRKLHIVWMEQIRLRTEDGSDLEERVLHLLRRYRVIVGIMDAFPYTDTILKIIAQYPVIKAAEYSIRDKTLPMMMHEDDNDIVKLNRSKTLSFMVKRVNSGQVQFPQMKETHVMASHLKSLRQIQRTKESGEVVQEWVSTGPDHYGHSLNYCNMAAQALMDSIDTGFAMAPTVKQANVGSKYRPSQAA